MQAPALSRGKNEVARDLIAWHFHVEPDLETIYLLQDGDGGEDGPIKLLEVSRKELEMIRIGLLALPQGWSLEGAFAFQRDDITSTKHAKVAV